MMHFCVVVLDCLRVLDFYKGARNKFPNRNAVLAISVFGK